MTNSDIEHMAQGYPPSHIGKDYEEVVIELAGMIIDFQQKLDALAAESAALKQVFVTKEFSTEVTDVFSDTAVLKIDGDEHHCHQWVDNDSDVIRAVLTSIKSENPTPATDPYLNSVRAEAVEGFTSDVVLKMRESGAGAYDYADIVEAQGQELVLSLRSGTHETADKAG